MAEVLSAISLVVQSPSSPCKATSAGLGQIWEANNIRYTVHPVPANALVNTHIHKYTNTIMECPPNAALIKGEFKIVHVKI